MTTQLPLGVQLRETATLDSFQPGPNEEALAAARAALGGKGRYLYFHGPAGTGKSHLLQAVCRAAVENGRRAGYLPLADLVDAGPAVLDGLTAMDLVCLDDLDAVAGRRNWEVALIGTLDALRAEGRNVLAAGRAAPGGLGLTLADLSTRLGWGAIYALRELDDDDKRALLTRRAAERGLEMPDEVARFLLRRCGRDVPGLLAVLDRLDHASLAAQRRLTVPFVREVVSVIGVKS